MGGLLRLLVEPAECQGRISHNQHVTPDVSRRRQSDQRRREEVLQDLRRVRVDRQEAAAVLEKEHAVAQVVLLRDVESMALLVRAPSVAMT